MPKGLVKHPRFGTSIRPSGFKADVDTVRESFWRYGQETIFPETAIPADLQKQTPATVPCDWYVDILKTCRGCRRQFIFYAVEQQHWYEVLRFKLDADCVKCPACRKTDQTLRRRFLRFSKAISRIDLSDGEFATLVADAIFLWENGLLSKRDKLNRIRNQARRRIPDHAATHDIENLAAGLDRYDVDGSGSG
ncbi:MAG: zinc-ribbon domain containing protein [Planctomycetales bacterium]